MTCGNLIVAPNISSDIDPWRDTKVSGLNWGYTNFDNMIWALLTVF